MRELTELLEQYAVSETKTINVANIGEIEIMMLNAGHAIDLFGKQGAELQLSVAALSLSQDGQRYADVVGFNTALSKVKNLNLKTALEIGEKGAEFSKLSDVDTEESEKNLDGEQSSTDSPLI